MKRKIGIALLLAATLMLSLLSLTACGDGNGERQVPIYQGMTITRANAALSLSDADYHLHEVLLRAGNGNHTDNGNHNGHYKGDHADRNDTVDEANPFPENNANETIEEEIKSSLNVVGSRDEIYYATPNEDIYINIHIDNPDSFEIMSFTLNGKKYSSYMFEEGSDMETIVLKYNVGNATGIVEYTIDAIKYIDGTEIKDVIIDGNKTVKAGIRTENQVAAIVTDVDIDTNALSFSVQVKDHNTLVELSTGTLKAVLYDGVNILSERDITVGDNSITFEGLKTNTLYQYAIVGYYDDLSGKGFGMNVLYKDAFYTDSIVLFDDIEIGQEGIRFSYLWHEDHLGDAVSSLKLYKGDTLVKELAAGATSVNDLLSNTTYMLVAEYNNAGKPESIQLEFTTLSKAVPVFAVKDESVGIDSILAEYDVVDPDGILKAYKVELYEGASLIAESAEERISFTALDCYTDYTLKITYTYDLNDGNGVQSAILEKSYKTLPYIDVVECNIANTSAVSEGETIFMSIKLDNPLGMSIESVVINGVTYHVAGSSTKNKIFVEIVYNEQFSGGDTLLTVDKINASIDNVTLGVEPKTVLSDNVFINGKIEILKVEIVNEALVPVSWAFPEDKLYVLVTLNNPTGYNVDSINATITDLVKLDDNRWYYEAGDLGSGLSILPLATLTYSNEYISAKTLTCSDKESWVYRVASNDAKCISTPDDLKNMGGGYYYELANDIDLAGIEWQGTSFCGVLNGKGYAIKNMSFVGTVKNTTAYLGLFSTGTGIIENLNIVEATIIAEVAYDEGEVYEAFCGAIVARADGRMALNGCTVDEYSTIGVRTIGTVKLYVGGLVGASLYDGIKITNSENNGGVSGVSAGYYAFVGGLLGHANGVVNLEGCLNTGSVSSTYIAGGLVGSSDDIIAKNCSNSGSITAITEVGSSCEYAGGIVGVTNDATIKSCTNSGSISGFQYAGGLVAYMHNAIVEDCTNSGSITGLEGAAGLLSHGESAKITGCKNTGNVSGRTAGGLLEIAHIVTIESCANSGSVSATGSDNPYAGGLVGAFYGDANATVANSVNSGSVSADHEYGASVAGGLVGYVWANATVTIEDCVNGGSIREGSGYGSIGGVLASLWSGSTATIENCYSLFSFSGGYNGEVCTVEELNSATFYTDTLGWSEDVWDFSDLDVANGKYPTLK